MSTIRITSKYYIRIHDKNLPGDDGYKVDFEMSNSHYWEYVPDWCDKFFVYEVIRQETVDDNGNYSVTDLKLNEQEYDVINQHGKLVFQKKEQEEEMEM